jgi:A nuclease family of the HNH/ENDO VII superfamily with conserved AHH
LAKTNAKPEANAFAEPVEGMMDSTFNANRIAAKGGGNPYETRNSVVVAEAKQRIRYKNGIRALPYSVLQLFADAERNVRHSDTLARNIQNRTGVVKPLGAPAHHIVACTEPLADGSCARIFGWGIGINDADNGVYLPISSKSAVASLPTATPHGPIHTEKYHLNVFARLRLVAATPIQRPDGIDCAR